jgi:hypothetical protein
MPIDDQEVPSPTLSVELNTDWNVPSSPFSEGSISETSETADENNESPAIISESSSLEQNSTRAIHASLRTTSSQIPDHFALPPTNSDSYRPTLLNNSNRSLGHLEQDAITSNPFNPYQTIPDESKKRPGLCESAPGPFESAPGLCGSDSKGEQGPQKNRRLV